MDHALFIALSYAGVGLCVALLIGFVTWDSRRVARRLKELEARGIRRRSAGTGA